MSLTKIPVQEETINKIKKISKNSETWDEILNKLYEHEITRINAQIFLESDTLTLKEALKEVDKWE